MTSIKLKFRAHTDSTKEGALYFQVIHERVVKQNMNGTSSVAILSRIFRSQGRKTKH